MKHFIGITALFVLYNIYFLLGNIGIISTQFTDWLFTLNSLAISIYLIAINIKNIRKFPKRTYRVIAVLTLLFFGLTSSLLFSIIKDNQYTLISTLEYTLTASLCTSVVIITTDLSKKDDSSSILWGGYAAILTILAASYSVYITGSDIYFLLLFNLLFLTFAGLKYYTLYSQEKIIQIPKVEQQDPLDIYQLTKNQKEITRLILEGKNYSENAELRHIAYTTVTSHASMIFDKVGAGNRDQLLKKLHKNLYINKL